MIKNVMARTVLGSKGNLLAVAQTRSVLTELVLEWPDVNVTQRTFHDDAGGLLAALESGHVQLALFDLADLPLTLPEGLELAAVTKRLEPRSTLLTKSDLTLDKLESEATVGVLGEREAAFLNAARPDLTAQTLTGSFDDQLAQLGADTLAALLLPTARLIQLERRQRSRVLLEPELFPPAAGQGCIGLVIRENDDLAGELAYTLHHRPSFDRVRAERSFAAALQERDYAVGTLANVSADGELALFGAVTTLIDEPLSLQAEISGEASEAQSLGRELAQDVLEQLDKQSNMGK